MLKLILIILAIAVAAVLVLAAIQPDNFSMSRSASMNASPSAVYAQVNDLHKWEAWSPWVKMDPNAKMTYEGPQSGKGAIVRWEGNNKIGAGSMTIIESKPHEFVHLQLDFLKPMKGTNAVEFTFTPEGKGTKVVWTMEGKASYLQKLIGVVMNCKKMISDQFDQGLANIKGIVEAK